jgi:type IV pilus assembly protein PilC
MVYHYRASQENGRIIEGEYEADTLAVVLQYLGTHHLRPLNIKVVQRSGGSPIFGGHITTTDKIFLTRYLALMLKVGTDLLSAINILVTDFQKPAVKSFLIEVRNNLSQGRPFYYAFAQRPKAFSPVFVSLVKAAETSGNLQSTFAELSSSLQKESELTKQVRAALIYPLLLLVVAVVIIVFLSVFALPRISKVFKDTSIRPPLFSRVVFQIGDFVGAHAYTLVGGLVVLVVVVVYVFWKTMIGRRIVQETMSRLPVVKNIYRDLAIQRFASTLSSLMRAGLPIIEGLHTSADVVNVTQFKVALRRIADEGLARGLTLGDAFRRESIFPAVITNLIAISEKAGHIDEVLADVADFYSSNIQAGIKTVVALLEPALLLIMGLLVAVVALAIIVPIYQLTSQF